MTFTFSLPAALAVASTACFVAAFLGAILGALLLASVSRPHSRRCLDCGDRFAVAPGIHADHCPACTRFPEWEYTPVRPVCVRCGAKVRDHAATLCDRCAPVQPAETTAPF